MLDTSPFVDELELDGDVVPGVVQAISEVLKAGDQIGRFDVPSAVRDGELRCSLKVSDALRERLVEYRAGDVDGTARSPS